MRGGPRPGDGDERISELFRAMQSSAVAAGVPYHRQRGDRTHSTKRKAWSNEEVALLIEGLQDFGWGKWSSIDADKDFRARGRNPTDLRTKATQLARTGALDDKGIRGLPTQ